jgi:hypothetical protein
LLAGILTATAVEVFAKLPFIMVQFAVIHRQLQPLGFGLRTILAVLLSVLLELLHVLLKLGRIARSLVRLKLLPIGLDFLLILVLLAAILVQCLTILVNLVASLIHPVDIMLDWMGLFLVFGMGCSRKPNQPRGQQYDRKILRHCSLPKIELQVANDLNEFKPRPKALKTRIGSNQYACRKPKRRSIASVMET